MVVDERYLYPTWLNLSRYEISQLVDQVWVDLRAIREYHPLQGTRRGTSGWHVSNAWPPSLIWGLFNILNCFFENGPALQPEYVCDDTGEAKQLRKGVQVSRLKELVLNVLTPTEAEMAGKSYVDPEKRRLIMGRSHRDLGMQDDVIPFGVKDPREMAGHLNNYIPDSVKSYYSCREICAKVRSV